MQIRNNLRQAGYLTCLLLTFANSSCKEEEKELKNDVRDAAGTLTETDYLWMTDVSEKGLIWPAISPAIYEDKIIVAGNTLEDKDMLIALDIESGEEIWRWTDFLTTDHTASINDAEYGINQRNEILLLDDGPYYYCIDLKSGSTIWKKRHDTQGGGTGIQILGNHFYISLTIFEDSVQIPTLVKGDLLSSGFEKLVQAPIDSIQLFINFFGVMAAPYVYEDDGEIHAFLQFSENVDLYSSKSFNYVASYNLSANTYNFEKTKLEDTVNLPFNRRPVMYQNIMIVNPDEILYGIDKHTGDIIWQRSDFKNNGDGVFTYQIYNEVLYAVNELGLTDRVMALDPLTGKTIWEDLGRGNSAHSLHFLNNVMYFTSRGDGELYAYDTENGKLVWYLKSPDVEGFQGFGGLRVIPGENGEKGKVIVCTYLNAYCYEAEK